MTTDVKLPTHEATPAERHARRTALLVAVPILVALSIIVLALLPAGLPVWSAPVIPPIFALGAYFGMTRRIRTRRRILSRPFPAEWEAVLQRDVLFYRALSEPDQHRFRRNVQVFLGEKRITGIGTPLTATTRVLAAASAIIPIFGFPEWEWDQISEILIYPSRFKQDFGIGDSPDHRTLGMVGTGAMNRVMILSEPDLIQGFRNPGDKRNVGIHEFAHLLDKSDGTIDGLPVVGLEREAIGPWVELVRRKMQEIDDGKSDIDPYALTNEAEFFAVASEYFFERPGVMLRKHPALYAMMSQVFRQNLSRRMMRLAREVREGRPRFGRNSPCPCGSGNKFKKCCLGKTGG